MWKACCVMWSVHVCLHCVFKWKRENMEEYEMKGERGNGIEMMRKGKGKKTVIIELYYGGLDE